MPDTPPVPADHATTLSRRIAAHTARLTIIGQGYVGLPLAVEFAKAGFPITGLDTDLYRVTALPTRCSHVPDVPSQEMQALLRARRYRPTTDDALRADNDPILPCGHPPFGKCRDPHNYH